MNDVESPDETTKTETQLETLVPKRVAELETWRTDVTGVIEDFRKVKVELAEFVFQTVTAIMGLIAIMLAIIIGFSTNWNFEDKGINYVIGLLIFLAIMISAWFTVWLYCKLRKN